LDETYERTLLDIDEENWPYAHRLFQCLVVAFRPLSVKELAEFLAFEFEEEGTTTFRVDWRSEDPSHVVLFTCSSLIAVVYVNGSAIVEFSHFSVKEYLTSTRIAKGRVPRYYIPLEPAHTLVTQACLSTLLHLGDHMTKKRIKDFPLAGYAARYWVEHAKKEDALSDMEGLIKRLFDPRKSHFATWIWIYDLDSGYYLTTKSPPPPSTSPLYFAALFGFYGVAEWLVKTCSQDVNAQGGRFGTPLHVASAMGSFRIAQLLLVHNAHVNIHCGSNNHTPLHDASRAGQLMVSRLLLDCGADIDAINVDRETPLFVALKCGPLETSVEAAELLLGRGADPNFRDRIDKAPIYIALLRNLLEVAEVLRKHGADPNARDNNGRTLLHLASELGQLGVAQRLLGLGVDVNARDGRGRTPLQVVGPWIEEDMVQLLLEHGADPNVQDDEGQTPLHFASRSRRTDAAQRLLTLGVDVNSRDNQGRTPLQVAQQEQKSEDVLLLLLDHGADPNVQDDDGQTPLHFASRWGKIKVARRLLELGAYVNSRDFRGRTPLHHILWWNEDVPLLLLKHNAEPDIRDEDGQTPLHVASQNGGLEVAMRLLELGVDVNSRDNRSRTPLHASMSLAEWEGDIDLLLLPDHSAEPDVHDEDGQTPLHVEVAKGILALGIGVNSRGGTPLHASESSWRDDIPLLLLKHNAVPDVRDEDGQTPLHVASQNGRLKVAKRLLELGVDVNSRDSQGRTPLHVASRWRKDAIAELLLKHGAERT